MIYLNTVKWLLVLLFKIDYSIQHYLLLYTQLNRSKYYISLTIQLNISHSFTYS